MLIRQVHVRCFRALKNASVSCQDLTALVGRNGTGKSSFLRALELFYDHSAKITRQDFYAEEESRPIEIAVTFSELTIEQAQIFAPYVDGQSLTVEKVFSGAGQLGVYYGKRSQHPEFAHIRHAASKRDTNSAFKRFRETENPKYASLSAASSYDRVIEELESWEAANPEACQRTRDDGKFFGFATSAQINLSTYTKYIRVPAVREAAEDATDKRGSCVTEIMDRVVRNAFATQPEVARFRQQVRDDYDKIFGSSKRAELEALQANLTATLSHYAPNTSIALSWSGFDDSNIPMPRAEVRVSEDGFEGAVERTGHGVQRAFILTMLQHLQVARDNKGPPKSGSESLHADGPERHQDLPSLLLAIEEPELYQHPGRQRYMAAILRRLAEGATQGIADRTQVMYTTHAPLFVRMDHVDDIKVLRKRLGDEKFPRYTTVAETDLDQVASQLWELDGQQGARYTRETLRPRMQVVMTPWMNEGFFADLIVLVEGDGDRSVVEAVASANGYDLEAKGICVIPCMGKANMDRPAVVFKNLNIPIYIIWDNDRNGKASEVDQNIRLNRRLLRLVGATEVDWPKGVWATHACLDGNLEKRLREELSEAVYFGHRNRLLGEFGMKAGKGGKKNPYVLRKVVEDASEEGHVSETLTQIVSTIVDVVDAC